MRVIAHMVVQNEAHRYLDACLHDLREHVDNLFVYDDRSSDATVEIASHYADDVVIRPSSDVGFMDHEGKFREMAFRAMETSMKPERGDWVLAIDADEFVVSTNKREPRNMLRFLVSRAMYNSESSVLLPIPEVFGWDGDTPLVRTDGSWGQIRGTRFFAWMPNGQFSHKAMGSGSEPTYVLDHPVRQESEGLYLMHFGYASKTDVWAKFERYSRENNGHASAHVSSIVTRPQLEKWNGPVPYVPKLNAQIA